MTNSIIQVGSIEDVRGAPDNTKQHDMMKTCKQRMKLATNINDK
jgi:hypothetical protein